MFKKFDSKESISGSQQLKSSVQKSIHRKLIEQYPAAEEHLPTILPKKDPFKIIKCHDHVDILARSDGELLFFRQREGNWIPTLKLLHQYPFLLPWMRVDKGAIRFILSGANIMCPGLTSKMAKMSQVEKGAVVAVMAEGKENALCIGLTTLSTDDIAKKNQGVGIENYHYLNDGLWEMKPFK